MEKHLTPLTLSGYDEKRLAAQELAIQSMTYVSSREHIQKDIMELLAMAHGHLQDIETIKEIPEESCTLIPALKKLEIMDLRKATKELIYEIFDIFTQYVNDLRENIKIQRKLDQVMTEEMERHILLVEERIELIQRFSQALAKKVSLSLKDYPTLQGVGQGSNKKSLK